MMKLSKHQILLPHEQLLGATGTISSSELLKWILNHQI